MNKDKLLSNIFYIATLIITLGLFLFFILNLFNVFMVKLAISYYAVFVLLLISIAVNLTIIILEKKRKFYISSLIKLLMFTTVVAYIVIFPTFGLYSKLAFVVIYQIFASLIFSIIGISIFFNNMKNKDNIVKAKPTFIILFSYCFTVSALIIVETLKSCVIYLAKHSVDVKLFLINVVMAVVLSMIYNIAFYLSLKQNKTIINYCIIEKL